jgi:hypothetical protein
MDVFLKKADPGTDVMILKNIFAEKFGEKNGIFCLNYC